MNKYVCMLHCVVNAEKSHERGKKIMNRQLFKLISQNSLQVVPPACRDLSGSAFGIAQSDCLGHSGLGQTTGQ